MSRSVQTTEDGTEFIVEQNVGTVAKVELLEGKRNAHVTFDVPGLRLPVKGWADSHNSGLWSEISKARDLGGRVEFRIEVHRSGEADPHAPMAEVGQTQRFRRIVALVPAPASAQNGSGGSQGAPPPQSPPEADRDDPGPSEPPQGSPESTRGPRVMESRPWEPLNTDGSLNVGSYAFLAAVGMVELAHELVLAHSEAEGDAELMTPEAVRKLARTLLVCADHVQANVRADHHHDRMDNSHARARGAVRTALEAFPVPWYAEPEAKKAWADDVVGWATTLLQTAVHLAGGD